MELAVARRGDRLVRAAPTPHRQAGGAIQTRTSAHTQGPPRAPSRESGERLSCWRPVGGERREAEGRSPVCGCRPAALLLENVPNLLRVDNGHALHIIVHALTRAGYHCRLKKKNTRCFSRGELTFFFLFLGTTAAFSSPTPPRSCRSTASASTSPPSATPPPPPRFGGRRCPRRAARRTELWVRVLWG